jgi:hypothetical protein
MILETERLLPGEMTAEDLPQLAANPGILRGKLPGN